MSSIISSFSAPISVQQGEQVLSFKPLSVNEIAEQVSLLKGKWISDAKRLVDECNITGVEKYKILRNAEDTEPLLGDLWTWAQTVTGAKTLVNKSASKSAIDVKVVEEFNVQDLVKLALQLSGYILTDAPTSETKEPKKNKIPQDPEGFKKP